MELQLLLPRGADQNQEDEGEGNVVAVPLALRVVPDLRGAILCIAGDLADRPKDPVLAVLSIGSEGGILALVEMPEQRGARVGDTFKTNAIQECAKERIRVLADTTSMEVIALRATNATMHISRSLNDTCAWTPNSVVYTS